MDITSLSNLGPPLGPFPIGAGQALAPNRTPEPSVQEAGAASRAAPDPAAVTAGEQVRLAVDSALRVQEGLLTAMRSGIRDPSLILAGLPPGSTGTLLGGGWVGANPGAGPWNAALVAYFFGIRVVPRVSGAAGLRQTADGGRESPDGAAALMAYGHLHGPHGPRAVVLDASFRAVAGIVDLLD